MPTIMLAPLVNIFGFASDINMDDIADMIFQLSQYFINQKHDIHFRHLC